MASACCTAGISYCRRSPAISSSNSSSRESIIGTMPLWSALRSFNVVVASSRAHTGRTGRRSACKGLQGLAPQNLCSLLARRAYYVEGASSHGTSRGPPPVEAVYEQYEGRQQQQRNAEFPRPPMIHWEKDLANGVQLIGYVGRDVDIRYLDTGKVVAKTSIAVKIGPDKNVDPSWFELEIWDELAEITAHHVKKGERIFVAGRIMVDKWVKDEVQHTVCKVVVRDLCFVERLPSNQRPAYGQSGGVQVAGYDDKRPVEKSRSWNQQNSSKQASPVASSSDAALAIEKSWQEFFADPSQWWDNRKNKKNPKGPDFKHKSTQEALWIDGWRNPSWVPQQLAVLEEKQAGQTSDFRDSHEQRSNKKLSSFRDVDFLY